MVRDRLVGVCSVYLLVVFLGSEIAGFGCGGGTPQRSAPDESKIPAALIAADLDRSNTARAAYYVSEATRYRDIAAHERQLSAAYARWTPPATATKDWNATLKAGVDARAIAADQIAAKIQTLADFHAAQAAAEVAR
jgi:hypothetical protein